MDFDSPTTTTLGRSPSSQESPSLSLNHEYGPKVRNWSQFELDTVCALICKHEHRVTPKKRSHRGRMNRTEENLPLRFASKLNEALNGIHTYQGDIPVRDVSEIMDFIETEEEYIMEYIRRQSAPFRITRSKKRAFQRLCNDFNRAFYRWSVRRWERHQDPNTEADKDKPRFSWMGRYSSACSRDSDFSRYDHISQAQKAEAYGYIGQAPANAQQNRYGSHVDVASVSDSKAHASGPHVLPVEPTSQFPSYGSKRRITSFPAPPTPSLSSTQHEQMGLQQPELYSIASHDGIHAALNHHRRGHFNLYDNFDPTPSTTPLPPASPAYFDHAELRQSIHPTGPRPETPLVMASPAYQYHSKPQQDFCPIDPRLSSPVSLSSPVQDGVSNPAFMGYQYPEPQPARRNGNFDCRSALETPTSPSSPMYPADVASTKVLDAHAADGQRIPYLSELVERPDLGLAPFNYGDYSLNYSS